MNKTLKRTLAIALTLVMLTAMVPMMASASGELDAALVAATQYTGNLNQGQVVATLTNLPSVTSPVTGHSNITVTQPFQ